MSEFNFEIATPSQAKHIIESIEFNTTDLNHKLARQQSISGIRRNASMQNKDLPELNDLQTEAYALSVDINTLQEKISEQKSCLAQLKHSPQEAFGVLKTVFAESLPRFNLTSIGGQLSFVNAISSFVESPEQKSLRSEFHQKTGYYLDEVCHKAKAFMPM